MPQPGAFFVGRETICFDYGGGGGVTPEHDWWAANYHQLAQGCQQSCYNGQLSCCCERISRYILPFVYLLSNYFF